MQKNTVLSLLKALVPCRKKGNMEIRFSLYLFFIICYLFMFPFCLHVTSALCKLRTIFCCIFNWFWIFGIFLIFLFVLDLNKNKSYEHMIMILFKNKSILAFYGLVFYCVILVCSALLYFLLLLLWLKFPKNSLEKTLLSYFVLLFF